MRGVLLWLSVMLAKLNYPTRHGPRLTIGCNGLSCSRRFLCRGIFLEISDLATYFSHFLW